MRLASLLAVLAAAPLAAAQPAAVLSPRPGQPAAARVTVVPMGPAADAAPAVPDIYGRPSAVAPARDVVVGGRSVVGRWLALEVEGDARASRDLADETLVKILTLNPGRRAILRGVDRRAGSAPEVFVGEVVPDGTRARLALDGLRGDARLELAGRRLVLTDPRGRRTVFLRLVDAGTTGYTTDALVPAPPRR